MNPKPRMTEPEAAAHLAATFDANVRQFRDIMEPYVNRLADDGLTPAERTEIMRAGLRETIAQRFPLPGPKSEIVPVTS